ncbi:sigma-70 family RNA polymerase sigma factor [Paenibacillus sp. MMS18-CY102]|nr:sigma-70 family RNA polymerase sigma factor [Paenibacillus sp. MMS18-CY102]MWC29422.1 sigma-70 family RNA polymerase sigma factor [Paenibacillus sp. MMS18-CY102]
MEIQPLLQPIMEGDEAAFRQLYHLVHPHIYRTAYFLAANEGDVNDIVSEVYMALFQAISSYQAQRPFRSWLNGIIVRQASNWKRKLWRAMRLKARGQQLWIGDPSPAPEEGLFATEEQREMLQHVNRLSAKLREVIVLRYYQDCSYEEIASALGLPLGTVKSRHHAAISKLRQALGEAWAVDREGGKQHVHT